MVLYVAIYIFQTIIFIGALAHSIRKKDKSSVLLLVCDLLTIVVVYFQNYEQYPWTKKIYPFATIDYWANGYNEGEYYGGWEDEYPQGFGRLTYRHFVDEAYYYITEDGVTYRAEYYEGEFEHGRRVGQGVVVYEGGFWEEGEFFGKWEPGKVVFTGRRWLNDERYKDLEIVAINGLEAYERPLSDGWIVVDK